jgi:hypothetical protein
MVLMNLNERAMEPRHLSTQMRLAVLGFFVGSLFLPRFVKRPVAPADKRPLQIEEQEVVVSVFDRLQGRLPEDRELKTAAQTFTHELAQNAVPALFDPTSSGPASSRLVSQSEGGLVFSGRFFDADSISQENALLRVLGRLNPALPRTGEIAVRGE